MTDAPATPEPVTHPTPQEVTPAVPVIDPGHLDAEPPVTPTLPEQPSGYETSVFPNLAFIFVLIPAIWWVLIWISASLVEPTNNSGVDFDSFLFPLGAPLFALWIIGIVFTHISWSKRARHTAGNRRKLVAAFTIGYLQIIPILMAVCVLLLGVLVLGFFAVSL